MRARLRLLSRRDAEERMDQELRFHIEMEAEKYVREGMSPEEAERRAAIAFGGAEGHKEEIRDGRTLAWASGLSLDLKLGLRMMRKYPGLTAIGVLGMAVAIAIGAASFEVIYGMMDADVPLNEGDRVVAIQQRNAAGGNPERQITHDFTLWREEVESIEDLGAFKMGSRNLIVPGGPIERVVTAEMTASGFRLTRVAPLLGRYLVEEDERSGAPPVIVIGHDAWRTRFESDPAVVGRQIRLDNVVHTVVGVMPEGFAFPINYRYWTPLRLDPGHHGPGEGPELYAFGRLAPGITMDQARAELLAISQRDAARSSEARAAQRPQVVRYTRPWTDLDDPVMLWLLHLTQLLISMLLVVVAVNVAILVYARTATRMGEIVVRTALGASRRRIVTQLFVEALVLAVAAAAAGLLLVQVILKQVSRIFSRIPFWIDFQLSFSTLLYAAGLTIVGAVIVGVLPGLKSTGRKLQSSLRQLGGGTGMQLGRTWTVLIVAQVAVAVAVLPVAVAVGWRLEFFRTAMAGPELGAESLLTARLTMSPEDLSGVSPEAVEDQFRSRVRDRQGELLRRLEADPSVAEVTFVSRMPGAEFSGAVEVASDGPDGIGFSSDAQFLQVDLDYFDVFRATLLAGRSFRAADLIGEATGVVVNRTFVQRVLGGGDALGVQLRYTRTEDDLDPGGVAQGDWYEIVGVVNDFADEDPAGTPMLYHPATPGEVNPISLLLRIRGATPEAFAGELREITAALDPALQIDDIISVNQLHRRNQRARRWLAMAIGLTTLSVLLLSAAGIHALMSLAVTQRRKEIGIRAALGADPRRILASIFARALRQLGMGVAVGLGAAALLDRLAGGALMGGAGVALLPLMGAIMLTVGMFAAVGPALRGLRIEPMVALRED